jgi:hypothetical protein
MIFVLFFAVALSIQDFGNPPVVPFPKRWKAEFKETAMFPHIFRPTKQVMNSTGAWYYDWNTKQAIHFHKNGTFNPFCSLNDKTHQPCWLRFQTSGALYTEYKDGTCCELCPVGAYCSILHPDWLTSGGNIPMYLGEAEINGATCYGYGRPGRVTKYDGWFVLKSDQKTPCAYQEVYKLPAPPGFAHNLTFDRATFSEDFPQSIFDAPEKCATKCPHVLSSLSQKVGTQKQKQ